MPTATIKAIPRRIWAFAIAHKFWSTIIALAIIWGGHQGYAALTASPTATRYVTTAAATSTVIATLTETGQVSASQTLTLSPKASGEVTGVYVKPGDHVYAGQIIAQLDSTDAQTALDNAKLSLAHEELSYQQTTATSTLALNLLQAKNALTNAQIELDKTHDASYASIASIYTNLSTVVSSLDSVLHDSSVPGRTNQQNIDAFADIVLADDPSISVYKNSAATSYAAAVTAYDTAVADYKALPTTVTSDQLVSLASDTYTAAQTVAQAVRNAHDFFDRINTDYTLYNLGSSSALSSAISAINTDTTTITTDLSDVLSVKSNIISAEQSVAEEQNTLQATEGGSNALTVQAAQLSLLQAKQAVTTAQQNLADYTVTAPFSGTIASVGVQKYDQASSGTSVATLVTDQETANISVNEVDASKIKVGQKAMLSFDALPDVTIAGTVASVDSVGSVSQGVVSYSVLLRFDTTNASVMPGMSVTADIITGTQTGLTVPANAIKASGTQSYVEVFTPPLSGSGSANGAPSDTSPQRVMVTTGLTDNTNTIITSGLTAGEQVVTQTLAGTATQTTTSAPSLFNAAGNRGARSGGAAFRAMGG